MIQQENTVVNKNLVCYIITMPDPGSPDQGPKPRGQGPKKGAFGWYKPLEGPQKPLVEPEQLHQTAEAKDEQSMNPEVAKQMAIKLFELENEIIQMLPNDEMTTIAEHVYADNRDKQKALNSYDESFGNTGQHGNVQLLWDTGELYYPTKMDLNTHFQLVVGIHGDKETREQYETLMKNGSAKNLQTMYYFTEEGRYGKVCELQPELKDSRTLFMTFDNGNRMVASEMQPEDFELAGAALQALYNRLKPKEPQEGA